MLTRRSALFVLALASAGVVSTNGFAQATAVRPSPATTSLPPATYRPEFGTMWTFDAPPLDYWRRTYGFNPDQKWLDHVRLSAVRLVVGPSPICSASFVSSKGLVMTNHHCGRDCTASSSPPDSNYIVTGFAAGTLTDEKKCAGFAVDQLQSIENVTTRVRSAVTAGTPVAQASQRSAIITQIQSECAQQTKLLCQVVTLYQGGIYSLYRYRRFSDVRLVMAPEGDIAFFGGDPDNFTFPRYDLDLTLLRVYENGQPYAPPDYLKWSANGAGENELVFIVGNPGSTGRLNTISQMEYLRDVSYPATLAGYERQLGVYSQVAKLDTSAARRYQNDVFSYANSQKAVTGYRAGLLDTLSMARKRGFEAELRARIAADPALRSQYAGAFDAVTAAQREIATFAPQLRFHTFASTSTLLPLAAGVVRTAIEGGKPDSARLAAYRGAGLANANAAALAKVTVDTVYERLAIAAQLRGAQAALPPNDPFLRVALNGRTPDAVAADVVRGTRISDSAFRASLIRGGAAAIAASTDPMIVLARGIDPLNRAVTARSSALNAIIATNSEKIGQAMFATYGTNLPPDATLTLRISDGLVKGFPMNGTIAPYKTTFFGLYERSASFDNKDPFRLPPRWVQRKSALDLATPFNFVSTNDIIGGNSGSPVINRNAEVVGLVFDSNIEGVSNRFIFSTEVGRSVSVHSRGITEALRKMYDGQRIANELEGR
ncbi:MAG TPA: S46 family peptidase [Gemmatimonadaceae bacterium]|nr:S46 family peptidase [Gemmatimonadaceae bacterium]